MRKKITLQLASAVMILLFSVSLQAANKSFGTPDNAEIKLNATLAYGTKVVQVSFNGNDGDTGFFQILNKDGVVMRQMDQVELIKSPSYFTIDASELPAGDYTFLIKTAAKTYTSTIAIN